MGGRRWEGKEKGKGGGNGKGKKERRRGGKGEGGRGKGEVRGDAKRNLSYEDLLSQTILY